MKNKMPAHRSAKKPTLVHYLIALAIVLVIITVICSLGALASALSSASCKRNGGKVEVSQEWETKTKRVNGKNVSSRTLDTDYHCIKDGKIISEWD